MADIDISPQHWDQQSSSLRFSAVQVENVAGSAVGTMAGNPFGVYLTPIFLSGYQELVGKVNTFNSDLGRVLDATAKALDASAVGFLDLDSRVAENFISLMSGLGEHSAPSGFSVTDSLAMNSYSGPEATTRGLQILCDVERFVNEARSGSWLGEFGGVALSDTSSAVPDSLSSSGLVEDWILSQIRPLTELFHEIVGNPGEVNAGVGAWERIAYLFYSQADDLCALPKGIAGEVSKTLDTYRDRVDLLQKILRAEGDAAIQIAGMLQKQGNIVVFLSAMVRDLISEALALFYQSATEVVFSASLGNPVLADQISAWVWGKVTQVRAWVEAAVAAFARAGALHSALATSLNAAIPVLLPIPVPSQRNAARVVRFFTKHEEGNDQDTKGKSPGLGDPVSGETLPIPQPVPWQYTGDTEYEGSGEHGQRDATPIDHIVHGIAFESALTMAYWWPDASNNLLHFLGNSGAPAKANVDKMLSDLPDFRSEVAEDVQKKVSQAVDDAKTLGVTRPVTYPFVTDWKEYYAYSNESANWYYATGGFQRLTAGTVTVYPPSPGNSEWTYKYKYQVHMADRYNWDGQKKTQIGPIVVSDKDLQKLHQAGLAREYDLTGESTVKSGP